MKLAGDHRFEGAGVQDVWDALFDAEVLAAAMPGCEKLDLVDGKLVGEMVIQVGPIKGKFTGTVAFEDRDEPRSYKMIVDGKGGPGFVKATATIALEADGAATRLRYDADAQIGGKLATVGARLVEASAKAIAKQSLDNLGVNIGIRMSHRAGEAKPADAESATATAVEAKVVEKHAGAAFGEVAPVETTPVPPVERASVEVTSVEATSAEVTSADAKPADATQVAATPVELEAKPVEAKPPEAIEPAVASVDAKAAEPAPVKPVEAKKPAYVKADAKAMAKEAAKASFVAMWPILVGLVVAIAVIIWLVRR